MVIFGHSIEETVDLHGVIDCNCHCFVGATRRDYLRDCEYPRGHLVWEPIFVLGDSEFPENVSELVYLK